jgi:hypothetical protein
MITSSRGNRESVIQLANMGSDLLRSYRRFLLLHPLVLVLTGVALRLPAPSALTAQAADTSSRYLTGLVEGLSPSAQLRLSAAGQRWTGRLVSRQSDSLTLSDDRLTRTVAVNAIDSVWLRRDRHDALYAAAGFGALMFTLLQLTYDGFDRGSATRNGGILFIGLTFAGMALDATANEWTRYYPE